jgi:AraC-like DNA-binding protein
VPVDRTLFETERLRVGEFCCRPGDSRWAEVNEIPDAAHLAFPRTSVVIAHLGREPVLTSPNHVMFYNAGQRYRRRLHDERGDYCVYLSATHALLAEVLATVSPSAHGGGGPAFTFDHGPGDADTYLLSHLLSRHLRTEPRPDRLFAAETAHRLLARAVETAVAFHARGHLPGRLHTRTLHRRLVEDAKGLLIATMTRNTTLAELARTLHSSEFHLARVFRAQTGFTLHAYRNHLRLRHALECLPERDLQLAELARGLGYCSHSHFGESFRSVFGVPPSSLREHGGTHTARVLRRIVEARLIRA